MDDDTSEKLQQLMQMAMLGANSPTIANGYGTFPPSPFESFPAPTDQFVSPADIFPLPIGGPNG